MVSPLIKVNGSLPASSGTTGFNVTAGSTVTITLNDSTGVNRWSIVCSNTDDLQTPAGINATLVQTGFSATFTAPTISSGRGASLQFTSVVNNGVDSNGTVQTSYIATFGIFVLGTSGNRMFFPTETNESNATFGCVADFNNLVTNPSPGATGSTPGTIVLTQDLGGTYLLPNVVGIQGNPVQSGVLGATQDGYVLTWTNSSSQWQARSAATILAYGQDYQFSNTSSDVGGYQQLLDVATGTQADLSQAVTSGGGKTLIKAFATSANLPGVAIIPAGLWQFNYYGYASLTGAFTTQLVFDVYTRTAGGAETLLFTVTGPNLNVTSVSQFNTSFNMVTDTYIADTTRLVIKVSAQTSNIVSVTAHFVFDGTVNTSLVRSPIAGDAVQLGGDLSGTTSSGTVVSISGASPIVITPATLQWANTVTSPTLKQADLTTASGSGQTLTIQAQNETGTTSTGGNLALSSGTGTSTNGNVNIQTGGSNNLIVGPTSTTIGAIATNVSTNFDVGGVTNISLTSGVLGWASSIVNPSYGQTALSSTSSTSGSAGQSMPIVSQAGQPATGAAHNGGAGGTLFLSGGNGGNSGSATGGNGGNVTVTSGAAGTGGAPINGNVNLAINNTNVLNVNSTIGVTVVGYMQFRSVTKTANYTIDSTATPDYYVLCNQSGAITITLPNPATGGAGRKLVIKDISGTAATNNITVARFGSEKIENVAASFVINQNLQQLSLISDGTNWWATT